MSCGKEKRQHYSKKHSNFQAPTDHIGAERSKVLQKGLIKSFLFPETPTNGLIGKGNFPGMESKFSKVRIGLNESQDRNCSSKQIQLPEALLQKETNELYAQGYLFYKIALSKAKVCKYKEVSCL